MADVDELARLLYEAVQSVAPGAPPETVIGRYRQLDRGLPAEDEFSVILGWLGRCRLVHKLDQLQNPGASRNAFRVPDLLAVMEYEGRVVPVLVEVKSTMDLTLSWREDYYHQLRRYGETLGLPVLVAWQVKPAGIWSLFDLATFRLARTNYKVDLTAAHQANLMGILAGDFMYSMPSGVGLHFEMRREETLERRGQTEEWRAVVEDAYVTNRDGSRATKLSPGLFHLFVAANPSETSSGTGDRVAVSFEIDDERGAQFAHRALVSLLRFRAQRSEVRWRDLLGSKVPALGRDELRREAEEGINAGFVRYILDVVPNRMPSFLEP